MLSKLERIASSFLIAGAIAGCNRNECPPVESAVEVNAYSDAEIIQRLKDYVPDDKTRQEEVYFAMPNKDYVALDQPNIARINYQGKGNVLGIYVIVSNNEQKIFLPDTVKHIKTGDNGRVYSFDYITNMKPGETLYKGCILTEDSSGRVNPHFFYKKVNVKSLR